MKLKVLMAAFAACASLAFSQSPVVRDGCIDAGSTDAYACNYTAPPGWIVNHPYWFTANTANTGTATFNPNSAGAKTIVKVQGAITTTLANNDIRAGQVVGCFYDGTNCQMFTQLGNAPASGGSSFTDFVAGSSTVANTGSDVTIYSYAAPALPASACYSIRFYLTFSGSVATSIKLFVGATQIGTPQNNTNSNTDFVYDIDYCNQAGVQNAQYLLYHPAFYNAGAPNNVLGNGGSGIDGPFSTPTGVDWSSGKTITIKTNAASDNTVGVYAMIHAH